jgi:hypothetical protein
MSWKPYTDDMKQDSEDVLSNTAMLTVEPLLNTLHTTLIGELEREQNMA